MGIKRKTFEFIKYYKLTEPSIDFVVSYCMWKGKKILKLLLTLDMLGA